MVSHPFFSAAYFSGKVCFIKSKSIISHFTKRKSCFFLLKNMKKEDNRAPISLFIIACASWIYTSIVQTPHILQLDGYSTERMQDTAQKSVVRTVLGKHNI